MSRYREISPQVALCNVYVVQEPITVCAGESIVTEYVVIDDTIRILSMRKLAEQSSDSDALSSLERDRS